MIDDIFGFDKEDKPAVDNVIEETTFSRNVIEVDNVMTFPNNNMYNIIITNCYLKYKKGTTSGFNNETRSFLLDGYAIVPLEDLGGLQGCIAIFSSDHKKPTMALATELLIEARDELKRINILIERVRNVTDIQCSDGNWNTREYMRGMANGLILAMSILEEKDPLYKDAPYKDGYKDVEIY